VEVADDAEIESRLQELTLDFGLVVTSTLSRPLRSMNLGAWRLHVWIPGKLVAAGGGVKQKPEARLPFALPLRELAGFDLEPFVNLEPRLVCDSFVEARVALEQGNLATVLPDFLKPSEKAGQFRKLNLPRLDGVQHRFHLAWNPRLLRLNPHAGRSRDYLAKHLTRDPRTMSPMSD
jgi:DNA-binding transcriptional LysR family regulator